MPLQPDQKNAIIIAGLAIIVLGGITLWNRTQFRYQDTTDYAKLRQQEAAQQQAYANYLKAIKPDPVASKELFQSLVTPADIQKQVEAELDIKQKITLPELPDSQITVKSGADKQVMLDYFAKVAQLATNYNNDTLNAGKHLFNADQDPGDIGRAVQSTQTLVQTLKQTPVPAPLVSFHKAQILTFDAYFNLLTLAKQYNLNEIEDPWPQVYNRYAIINSEMAAVTSELNKADQIFHLSDLALPLAVRMPMSPTPAAPRPQAGPFGLFAAPESKTSSQQYSSNLKKYPSGQDSTAKGAALGLIKPAQAILGAGDTVIIVGNVPDAIKEGIKQGLASAFANFATKFLDKLITQIEKNYKISNFLYYSDALVQGEYVNDYLDKYVNNPLDRQIILRFIPQFSCANKADFQQLFEAKARDFLGFDPANVDPKDPQFYEKLAKVGNFFASPNGWELYFRDAADQAQSQAEKAATLEISSPGLKAARDLVSNQIQASLASINNAEAAAYVSVLNLGVVNVENIVSKVVSGVTTNLFNKFVFKGAIVFKESETCIPVPQLQPVLPISDTQSNESSG